ncbi:acyl carrier protein [Methylobacterium gregans]|uniref:Aminoacyl carrier protein n=1 Tax=Methylobacterium gregans TaxID=374424 RepID=A0AA37MA59_9HYPH|nr:acyl carrier protein [Methylobacterium gregans]MDQ0523268.1 acyl carrier protein [Methylobacterium gregans]GJD77538.1 Aminoacyl carrier protein [Methylobacterium gregans]GLS53512.1 aminoacyl carrier protein [Methylobacterium gregans]
MVSPEAIRNILARNEALAPIAGEISEDENLFDKGLDSFGSVQLMLALEEHFDVEFPDHLLSRKSFSTIRSIRETVSSLVQAEAA